jgi:hypothetical protein
MLSPHNGPDSRQDISYCVEGWVVDQHKQALLESGPKPGDISRYGMSDLPWTRATERASSPSKRQRTSNAGSSSQWVERLSSIDPASTLPSFTEPTSSGTSASRAPSPTKSIRNRRIQLEYTNPAIYFGPPKNIQDSEEGSSDSSSGSGAHLQQIQRLSLEHTTAGLNSDSQNVIPPAISALVRRLSEEAADPVLPPDIISRINSMSPTESFRQPEPGMNPSARPAQKLFWHISRLFEMARELYASSYDESAWYPLIREILIDAPHLASSTPFVKHEEAHTRQVCTDLLPEQNGGRIPTVKVDHLLQFNPGHRHISPLCSLLL